MKKRVWILAVLAATVLLLSSCGKVTITAEEAKDKALAEAGVTAEAAQGLRAHLERDDGRKYYEVDFYVDGTEYDVEVDAETGEILKFDREGEKAKTTTAPITTTTVVDVTPTVATVSAISADRAKSIALAEAGVTADQVKGLTANRERDDGREYYEVSFYADGMEYEYEIEVDTGAIISKDHDKADRD